jgi:hypothetical protein
MWHVKDLSELFSLLGFATKHEMRHLSNGGTTYAMAPLLI